jgi:multidrug efflux pump subunit AcrB
MSFSKFSIDNHHFMLIVMILLVMLGAVSFFTMPKSEDPAVQPAGASVIVIYPGGSPADMEELVVEPIEEALNELEDIKTLHGEASDGLGIVDIEFEAGSDPDKKYSDVVQKANGIRSKLPNDILGFEVMQWSISDVYIIQLALISDSLSFHELESEAESIKKKIERLPGIRSAALWAIPKQEVRVSVDLARLARLRVPLMQVMGAIMDANTNIPGGEMDIGSKRLSIKTSTTFQNLDDIRRTVVQSAAGKAVRLSDVADVSWSAADPDFLARVNGHRAVFITANQKDGTNIFDIFKKLRTVIDDSKKRLPGGMRMETVFDQSKSVASRVNGFLRNLIEGILLVGVVLLFADSSRASIIVMLAVPLSCIIGIGILDLSGYGLEQVSIAGLVIALGMLVDDAIVVTDNISRFRRNGHSDRDASILGTNQVGWAVTSSTLTTVLAFMPIILMQSITGDFIRSMPLTVVYTMTVSLLISLTVTPYLSFRFMTVHEKSAFTPPRRLLNRFIETRYRKGLDYAMKHPKKILLIAGTAFVLSLCLFPLLGVSLFPKAEKPQLFVNVELPAGTRLEKTDAVAKKVEAILAGMPEVKNVTANVGHGNPRLYYNVFPERQKSSHAQIFLELKRYKPKEMERFVRTLRERFDSFPEGRIEVKELEQGNPVEAPVVVRVIGDKLDMLDKISRDVEAIVREQKGAVNVRNPLATTKADLRIRVNRTKAATFGVALSEIERTVRAAVNGLSVTQFRDSEGKAYDITVRLPLSGRPSLSDFDRIYVTSLTGTPIPLKQIASLEFTESPLTIHHNKLERTASVTADMERGVSVDRVSKRILKKLEAYPWPKGYRYEMGGEIESREEAFGGMGKAILAAMLGVFAILVLQFKSYLQPLIIFSALPLAVIGSILALLATGNTFSFSAFIGLTSLVGIVVKNSILLVDYTNQLRAEGLQIVPALKAAGERRFVPILLTAATTVGGLLPLTLAGGSFWAPMGWTIIGGLTTSTALTLIVVPVLYLLYTKK